MPSYNMDLWCKGGDRIRRDGFVIRIGDQRFDVDRLVAGSPIEMLREALSPLSPLTTLECMLLVDWIGGALSDSARREFCEFLWICSSTHTPPATQPTEPPAPATLTLNDQYTEQIAEQVKTKVKAGVLNQVVSQGQRLEISYSLTITKLPAKDGDPLVLTEGVAPEAPAGEPT